MEECSTCGVISPYVKLYAFAENPQSEDFNQTQYFCNSCGDNEDWVLL